MMFVDRRTGSKELMSPLQTVGLKPELTELEYGDVAFQGKGEGGVPVDIGVELKTLNDFIGSVRSGRFTGGSSERLGQLQGMRGTYHHSWLIIEGYWRHDEAGQLVTYKGKGRGWCAPHGKMSASELEKHALTYELLGGIHVRYTNSRRDTVRFLHNLYRWWTDQAFDAHTSHLAVHRVPTLVPVSDFRRVLCQFPGIALKTSKAVEDHFGGSLLAAISAGVPEWANITVKDDAGKSRRIGEATAERIVRFCRGRKRL